jgi:glycerol-3-phosphate dehydrogenase
VREALQERGLLLGRLAPHLVRPVPFLFPLRNRVWERLYVGTGVTLYDTMGGARALPRHRPLLAGEADDTARLSREHTVCEPVPGRLSILGAEGYEALWNARRRRAPPRRSRPRSPRRRPRAPVPR